MRSAPPSWFSPNCDGVSGVLTSRISGAGVEIRVRPAENAVLYSDCVWKRGFNTVWFKNSSNENQTSLFVSNNEDHPRHAFVWNPFNKTSDLLVKNVTESDLGLFYCALQKTGSSEYINGNSIIRLSFLGKVTHSDPLVFIVSNL